MTTAGEADVDGGRGEVFYDDKREMLSSGSTNLPTTMNIRPTGGPVRILRFPD